MKRGFPIILLCALVAGGITLHQRAPREAPAPDTRAASAPADARLADDHTTREVTGRGTVIRLLADDTRGERHQRILLRLPAGGTLLIAHNIDLAPRVAPLVVGDTLEYHGEYVWNDKGGVVHWTHRDPAGRHDAGWLRHAGQTFQ
ncbi:MAG: DUF3465 domain-containing protein [Lysobacteraceae bacterium]